jgi:hypothetical protein
MVARPDQVLALHINDYDLSLSRYHGAVIGLPKINLLATSPKDRRDYSPRPEARPFPLMDFCRPASRREPLQEQKTAGRYDCQRYVAGAAAVPTLRPTHETDPADATIWRITRSVHLRMRGMRHIAYRGMQADGVARGRRVSKAGKGMPRSGEAGAQGRSGILAWSVQLLAEARAS